MTRIPIFLAFISTNAIAHPQAGAGLLHRTARRPGLTLPLAFLSSLFAGALLARAGVLLPAAEAVVVGSVAFFAAALIVSFRNAASVLLASGFALFHGYVHVAEMPQGASAALFITGMLAGSVLLLAVGFTFGRRFRPA